MEFRLLAVGDVVAPSGLSYLQAHLRSLKKAVSGGFCVVNGENASLTGAYAKSGRSAV